MNHAQTSITVIIMSIAALILVVMIVLTIRSQYRLLKPLARVLGGDIQFKIFTISYVVRLHKGKTEPNAVVVRVQRWSSESYIWIEFAGKYSPPFLVLKTLLPVEYSFIIRKKGIKGRFWESIGKKGIKLSDLFFDERYYVKSDDPAKVTSLLQEEKRRQAIDFLFSMGFISIEATGNSIITFKPYRCIKDTFLDEMKYTLRRSLYRNRFSGIMADDLNKDFIVSSLDNLEKIIL